MKKVLPLAIAAALVAPAAAMADATVYGKIRVATDVVNEELTISGVGTASDDRSGMSDQSSRIGIKGSEDLGNGLKAIYQMEFGASVGEEFDSLSGRNAYVGVAGGFGTFLAGRHDTPMKMSTGKLDLFADTIADYDTGSAGIAGHSGLFIDRRTDGTLAYISPNWAGLTLAGALVQFDTTDDFVNAYSLAGMYENGPFFGSIAYEELEYSELMGTSDDESDWRVGLGLMDMAGFTVAFVYEDVTSLEGIEDIDVQSWQLSGAYKFGASQIKGMYGAQEWDYTIAGLYNESDYDVWAIGYQYNLSKRTDAQIIYTERSDDAVILGLNSDYEMDGFSLQLNHNF
jgi:predicted porin